MVAFYVGGEKVGTWDDGAKLLTEFTARRQEVELRDEAGTLIGRCRPVLNGAHGIWGDEAGRVYLAEGNPSRVTRLVPIDEGAQA